MNGRRRSSGYDWVWRPTRFAVYERDGWRCAYCLAPTPWTGRQTGPHLDHVVPTSGGGTDRPGNLVTSCAACNVARANRTLGEWLAALYPDLPLHRAAVLSRVARQVSLPLDRARGRELCEELCPGFLARRRARDARRGEAARRAAEERRGELEEAPF